VVEDEIRTRKAKGESKNSGEPSQALHAMAGTCIHSPSHLPYLPWPLQNQQLKETSGKEFERVASEIREKLDS
jgi:hypothetical protein